MPKRHEYIDEVPRAIPPGRILVHNHVLPPAREEFGNEVPTYKLGFNGFRAWLTDPTRTDYKVEVCDCDWAAELGPHYRVVRQV